MASDAVHPLDLFGRQHPGKRRQCRHLTLPVNLPHQRPTASCPVTAFVVNDAGDVLLEQRSDNGRWGMPGSAQEVGENIAGTVVREILEETGIHVEVVGLVGIFTDPGHVIAFADGEVRQEFSLCFRARPIGGEIKVRSQTREFQRAKEKILH